MICPKCNTPQNEQAQYCTRCGAVLAPPAPPMYAPIQVTASDEFTGPAKTSGLAIASLACIIHNISNNGSASPAFLYFVNNPG
ncbi:MAG: hypothetical protein ACYDBB_15710 [Armatimonadota bacterium]